MFKTDPVEAIMRLTEGRGVDVAIEALGTQKTFEFCLCVLRRGGKERMRRLMALIGSRRVDLRICGRW